MTTILHLLSPAGWSISGLLANLFGVILLFRFGIPYYVRTGGASIVVASAENKKGKEREDRASRIGWCGLGLVVVGTAMQMLGSLPQP